MQDLVEKLAALLKENKMMLVTAESCTGGLLSARLTAISGSSSWFEGGFVTYAPRLKTRAIGVSEAVIEAFGVVSEPVAAAMATGALNASAATLSVSLTGVAGPQGGDILTPVGTVWFGWAARQADGAPEVLQTSEHQFSGDRASVRKAACEVAIDGLLRVLRN